MQNALNLHLSKHAAQQVLSEHAHASTSFCLVIAGSYSEAIRSRITTHGKGDLLVCPAATPHAQQIGAQGALKLIFNPEPETLEYLYEQGISLEQAPYLRSPQFEQLGMRLLQELRNDDAYSHLARQGMALELITAFARASRDANNDQQQTRAPAWLRMARDYLHDHEDVVNSLEQIALSVARHPVYLSKEFKRYYGVTIGEYQRQLRLKKAAQLLQVGRLDLSEVALSCGFASHANLCRSFKAAYGMSPSSYRQQFK